MCVCVCVCVNASFPFGFEGGIWYLVVLLLDHCLSLTFQLLGHVVDRELESLTLHKV